MNGCFATVKGGQDLWEGGGGSEKIGAAPKAPRLVLPCFCKKFQKKIEKKIEKTFEKILPEEIFEKNLFEIKQL